MGRIWNSSFHSFQPQTPNSKHISLPLSSFLRSSAFTSRFPLFFNIFGRNQPKHEKQDLQITFKNQQESFAQLFKTASGTSKSEQITNGDYWMEIMGDKKRIGLINT